MGLLWDLVALFVYGNLVVLVHELGHVALARAGGYRVTSFGLGLGPPVARVALRGGVVLHLDRWWIGGSCTAIPRGPVDGRRAWFHGGGLLAQLGLAAVLAVALAVWPDQVWLERTASFNLLVGVTNAIPWRFGEQVSDGWRLLEVWLPRRRTGLLLPIRADLERLHRRELAVGSPVGAAWSALSLAWTDVTAGRVESARGFFESDPAVTTVEPWFDALYHYVRAEWHRLSSRPLAALRTAREARLTLEDATGQARALLDLAEARALADLDAPMKAARVIARVAGTGGPVARQAAAIHLLTLEGDDADELEHAVWRVSRSANLAWLDPVDVVAALYRAARLLQGHGRGEPARAAREAATRLTERTLSAAADTDRIALQLRLDDAVSRRRPGLAGTP